MDLIDYIEGIENELSKGDGRGVIRCVYEFSKLLGSVMPESGVLGLFAIERFLSNNASRQDLLEARINIWKDIDENHKNTQKENALRAVICGLFFPIERGEHFETITYAIDFCKNTNLNLSDTQFKEIISNEFET